MATDLTKRGIIKVGFCDAGQHSVDLVILVNATINGVLYCWVCPHCFLTKIIPLSVDAANSLVETLFEINEGVVAEKRKPNIAERYISLFYPPERFWVKKK